MYVCMYRCVCVCVRARVYWIVLETLKYNKIFKSTAQ